MKEIYDYEYFPDYHQHNFCYDGIKFAVYDVGDLAFYVGLGGAWTRCSEIQYETARDILIYSGKIEVKNDR